MRSELAECGRDSGVAYAPRIYVCGNAEIICDRVDDSGNGWKDEAAEAHAAGVAVLIKAGLDYETDSTFSSYRGGPRTGLVDVAWYRADLEADDDGDERPGQWNWCRSSLVPPAIAGPVEAVAAEAAEAMYETARRLMDEAQADRQASAGHDPDVG